MASDDKNKDPKFSFDDGEENQQENNEDLEFTFSDIPVLGKDSKSPDESFSFDTFAPPPIEHKDHEGEENPEHLSSFTSMLQEQPGSEEDETDQDEDSSEDHQHTPSQEELDQKKAKWEKISKGKRKKKIKPAVLIGIAVAFLVVVGGITFLLLGGSEAPKEPKPKPPPQPGVRPTPPSAQPSQPPKTDKPGPRKPTKPDKSKKGKQPGGPSKKPGEKDQKEKDAKQKKLEEAEEIKRGLLKQKTEDLVKKIETAIAAPPKEKPEEEEGELRPILLELIKLQPKDIKLQQKIQKQLIKKHPNDSFVPNIYRKCLDQNKRSAIMNFCYGYALGYIPIAEKYLKKAIKLDKKLIDAYVCLGEIYTMEQKWDKAIGIYEECLKNDPKNLDVLCLLATVQWHNGAGMKAITDLKNTLRKQGLADSQISVRLIPLAQRLPDSKLADECLKDIKKNPKLRKQYQYYKLRNKVIYGTLSKKDFDGWYPKKARLFHILYLLSDNEFKKIQLLPTPPEEFPDFWKIYIGWLIDDALWRKSAEKFLEKHAKDPDPTYKYIVYLWLGKKDEKGEEFTPIKARSMLDKIPPDNLPLYYFMLAEYYRKIRKKIKARILYRKAKKNRLSPYFFMIRKRSRH